MHRNNRYSLLANRPVNNLEHGKTGSASGFIHLTSKFPHHHLTLNDQTFHKVYIEHLIYSAALAVIVGMIFSRLKGSDPSWIIIAVAFVPDIDFGLQAWSEIPGIALRFTVQHGDFHNITALILFSLGIVKAIKKKFIRAAPARVLPVLPLFP